MAPSAVPVTVMGVRKKRKDGDTVTGEANGAQSLDAGLVRKKAKVETMPVPSAPAENTNGVQVLGAGLVRKKPKP
jgi:regulator of Ty1 transposition protein 109